MSTLSDYGSPVAGIAKCMIDNFSKAAGSRLIEELQLRGGRGGS